MFLFVFMRLGGLKMTEFRKVISFGKSSFIVSLPKTWVEANHLKKGDIVALEEDMPKLIIMPGSEIDKDEERSIEIDLDKLEDLEYDATKAIWRTIIRSYINYYTTIIFRGKKLATYQDVIRNCLNSLGGFEILEHRADHLLVKNLLDMTQISLMSTLKRMDRIIRSMLVDSIIASSEENVKSIKQRDLDVNRLQFLCLRYIRYSLNHPSVASKAGYSLDELFAYWGLIILAEDIADEAKRMAALVNKITISKAKKEKLVGIMQRVIEGYCGAVDAFYTKDLKLAHIVSDNGKKNLQNCEDYFNSLDADIRPVGAVIEKLKIMQSAIRAIAKVVIDLR